MSRRHGGPTGFGGVPMDKPIKESTFRPNRSPRQPGPNQTRGRQNYDKLESGIGGRHRRKALGCSNVRLLAPPTRTGDATQIKMPQNQSWQQQPSIQPSPTGRAGVRWAYGIKAPNPAHDDRGSYLKPREVGSLLLTVHNPKSPHSLSPRKKGTGNGTSPNKNHRSIKGLGGMTYKDLVSGQNTPDSDIHSKDSGARMSTIRRRAQRDIWKNRVESALKMLKERMAAHPSLARVFQSWDEDGSGTLSRDEISRALGMLNVHLKEEEMDAIFLFFDRDDSGEVSSREFLEAVRQQEDVHVLGAGGMLPGHNNAAPLSDVSSEVDKFKRDEEDVSANKLSQAVHFLRKKFTNAKNSHLYGLLRQYDVDNDGFIDCDELRSIMAMLGVPLTKAEIQVLMHTEFATDTVGQIRYDELVNRLQDPQRREWDSTFLQFEKVYADKIREETNRRLSNEVKLIHGKSKFRIAAVDLAPKLVRVLKQNMGRIMHAFKRFDVNGDGELDRQEFGEMLGKFAAKNDEIDITKQDIDMIFHFFDRDGGGSIEMEEMVRALYELRDIDDRRDVIGGNVLSSAQDTLQNALGKHSNTSDSAWVRNQQGKVAGGSSSKVTIFAPNGSVAPSDAERVDPLYHLKTYRTRREYLHQWSPSVKDREYINSSVVYNPQNVARQENLIRRNEQKSARKFN
eukprot:g7743.t1